MSFENMDYADKINVVFLPHHEKRNLKFRETHITGKLDENRVKRIPEV